MTYKIEMNDIAYAFIDPHDVVQISDLQFYEVGTNNEYNSNIKDEEDSSSSKDILHITAITDFPKSHAKIISFKNIVSEIPDVEYSRLGILDKPLTYANQFLHIPPEENPIYASNSRDGSLSLSRMPTTTTARTMSDGSLQVSKIISCGNNGNSADSNTDIHMNNNTFVSKTVSKNSYTGINNNISDPSYHKPTLVKFNQKEPPNVPLIHIHNTDFKNNEFHNDNYEKKRNEEEGDVDEYFASEPDINSDEDSDTDNSIQSDTDEIQSFSGQDVQRRLSKTLSSISFISRTTTAASQAHSNGMSLPLYGTQEFPYPQKSCLKTKTLLYSNDKTIDTDDSEIDNMGGIDPEKYYRSVQFEKELKLAEENCIYNGGANSLQQSKFSNLNEVEDIENTTKELKNSKDNSKSSLNNTSSKTTHSKLSKMLGGRSVTELTDEELNLFELQLSKSRKSSTGNSLNDFDFDMTKNSRLTNNVNDNQFSQQSFKYKLDETKKKLLTQNGYPTRPWIRSKSIILSQEHPEYASLMKEQRNEINERNYNDSINMVKDDLIFTESRRVFIYINGKTHTWTSIEYYFKYFAQDGDHLIIGTRIPKDVIDPRNVLNEKFNKTSGNKSGKRRTLNHYNELEQYCEESCEDILKFIYYKIFVYDKKIKFTLNMSRSNDSKECVENFLKEYNPHLVLITSISFNFFIKFSNSHIKLSRLFTRFLRFCIIINQDFLNIEKPKLFQKTKKTLKNNPLDVLDKCIIDSCQYPFLNEHQNEKSEYLNKKIKEDGAIKKSDLDNMRGQTNNKYSRTDDLKYKVSRPYIPEYIKDPINSAEEFFMKYGYIQSALKPIQYGELDIAKHAYNGDDKKNNFTIDYSYLNFIKYINKRRCNERVLKYYQANFQVLKPAMYYIDNFNRKEIERKKSKFMNSMHSNNADDSQRNNYSKLLNQFSFPEVVRAKSSSLYETDNMNTTGSRGSSFNMRNGVLQKTRSHGPTSVSSSNMATSTTSSDNNYNNNDNSYRGFTNDGNVKIPEYANEPFKLVSIKQSDMKHFRQQKRLLEEKKKLKAQALEAEKLDNSKKSNKTIKETIGTTLSNTNSSDDSSSKTSKKGKKWKFW